MSPARAHRLVVDLASTSKNWSLPEWGQEKLLAIAPEGWDVHMVRASTKSDGDGGGLASAEVLEAVRDAEVYFGFGVSESVFAAAPGLRWVHSAAAGVGSALFPAMRQGNVLLTNSAGIMGDTIAEHVVGGVIYLLRSMDIAVAQRGLMMVDLVARENLPTVDLGELSGPHGIEFAGGKVWFTSEGAEAVGSYDPVSNRVQREFATGQEGTQ